MDPIIDRLKKQQLIESSDMDIAKDAFSGLDESSYVNIFNPKDEKDFDALVKDLSKKLSSSEVNVSFNSRLHQKSIHYKNFCKNLCRSLLASMKADDIKDIASTLTVLANEKLKMEKAPKKKVKGIYHFLSFQFFLHHLP